MMRQIGKDFPWPNTVGIGQGVSRDGLAAKSQVIEMMALNAQIDLDVPQRFARSQQPFHLAPIPPSSIRVSYLQRVCGPRRRCLS